MEKILTPIENAITGVTYRLNLTPHAFIAIISLLPDNLPNVNNAASNIYIGNVHTIMPGKL